MYCIPTCPLLVCIAESSIKITKMGHCSYCYYRVKIVLLHWRLNICHFGKCVLVRIISLTVFTASQITNVWFQKISIPPPRKTLWFAPPHPPGFSVPGGLWWPPLPPGISRIFNRGLRSPFFGNSKWFWYFKTKEVNTNVVSYRNTVESYYNSAV